MYKHVYVLDSHNITVHYIFESPVYHSIAM